MEKVIQTSVQESEIVDIYHSSTFWRHLLFHFKINPIIIEVLGDTERYLLSISLSEESLFCQAVAKFVERFYDTFKVFKACIAVKIIL